MASRFILPFADVGDGITPKSGAKLFFTATGTSTDKDTFSDQAATVVNTNPVIADASGLFSDIFIVGSYKVVLKDKNNVQKWESDPVTSLPQTSEISRTFATVAAMVADTSLATGDFVATQGYLAAGDNGENTYEIVAAATGTDDGGSFIDLATHQGKGLFPDAIIRFEQFLIFPSRSAAQNKIAIDNMFSFGGNGNYQMDEGTVTTTGNHAITNFVNITGAGMFASILKLDGSNTGDDMFQLGAGSDSSSFNNMQILGNWDTSTTPTSFGHGIVHTAVSSIIRGNNIIIQKFTGAGTKLIGGIKHYFENVNWQTCGLEGLWLDGSTNPITNVTIVSGSSQVMRRGCFRHEDQVAGVRYFGVAMFISPICIRFAGTSSAVHTEIIGGYIEDIALSGVPKPTFRISASAPLDADDGGSTSAGTGDVITLSGVDIKGDAAGRTIIANTAIYRWVLSASGTAEYYVELLAGGDPSLVSPNGVRIDPTVFTELRQKNKLGFLPTGEWGYGDNDTLGFNTVYVRLDDGTDPDTKATGFIDHLFTWDLPDNTATIGRIEMIGTGSFASRPQLPVGATDPNVFFEEDSAALVQARAIGAFPKGVERRLTINSASGGNAGKSKVIVAGFNSVDVKEEAFLDIDGSQRKWEVGSTDIGTSLIGDTLGAIQFKGVNTQATVGAAGAATALPANPTGYLEFKDDAGTNFVIPFYAKS